MRIVKIDMEQVGILYPRLQEAFPKAELKSLKRIKESIRKDTYDCFGLEENSEIIGCAYFVKTGHDAMLDYLCVWPDKRNNGCGSASLAALRGYFDEMNSVIAEVEDPDTAQNDDERTLRTRRLGFYLRNGFVDTGVRAVIFNVRYRVIRFDDGKAFEKEEIREIYRAHYRAMLPENLYEQYIDI